MESHSSMLRNNELTICELIVNDGSTFWFVNEPFIFIVKNYYCADVVCILLMIVVHSGLNTL